MRVGRRRRRRRRRERRVGHRGRARGGGRDSAAGCVGGCGGGDVRRRGEVAPGAMHRLPVTWRRVREPPVRNDTRRVSHEARRDAAPGRRAPLPRVRRARRRDERPQDGRRAVRVRRVLSSRRGAPSLRRAARSVGSRRRVAVGRVRVVGRAGNRTRDHRRQTNRVLLLLLPVRRQRPEPGSRAGVAGARRLGAGPPRSHARGRRRRRKRRVVGMASSGAGGTRLRGSPSPPSSAAR